MIYNVLVSGIQQSESVIRIRIFILLIFFCIGYYRVLISFPVPYSRLLLIYLVHSSNPKEGNAKECSSYHTIALISHTIKVMLKILQARLQFSSVQSFSHVWLFRTPMAQHLWDMPILALHFGSYCLFIYLYLNLFIFNWKIIALQYYVGFCHTSTWISHRYILHMF